MWMEWSELPPFAGLTITPRFLSHLRSDTVIVANINSHSSIKNLTMWY